MQTFLTLCLLVFTCSFSSAQVLSAFKARDLAAREVNNESRTRVIEIYGPKSETNLLPTEWNVLFYDPYAQQDGRLVRVVGNSVVAIREGYTQLDRFRLAAYKLEEVMEPSRLKIDSDGVLNALRRSTALRNTTISRLQMRLRKPEAGNYPAVWFVKIYTINKESNKESVIGDAQVSAETGQVLRLELNLEKSRKVSKPQR
jgi:hypothetical protein